MVCKIICYVCRLLIQSTKAVISGLKLALQNIEFQCRHPHYLPLSAYFIYSCAHTLIICRYLHIVYILVPTPTYSAAISIFYIFSCPHSHTLPLSAYFIYSCAHTHIICRYLHIVYILVCGDIPVNLSL